MTKQLLAGYQAFYQHHYIDHPALFSQLKQGQAPEYMVICCSDSRVEAATLFGTAPGDIFVVRHVANLVPIYTTDNHHNHPLAAALEFAICALQIEKIVVLGHSNCGGIRHLMSTQDLSKQTDFVSGWMQHAIEAKQQTLHKCPDGTLDQQCQLCEKNNVRLAVTHLQTFPWVSAKLETGSLSLHGWYFNLSNGKLERLVD